VKKEAYTKASRRVHPGGPDGGDKPRRSLAERQFRRYLGPIPGFNLLPSGSV